jgi:hypothetical protein
VFHLVIFLAAIPLALIGLQILLKGVLSIYEAAERFWRSLFFASSYASSFGSAPPSFARTLLAVLPRASGLVASSGPSYTCR